MEYKISIIVPVYQAEQYIRECLLSLVKQNISGIEIICVDDGSKDQSANIIKKLQQQYKEIVYIYQKNQGVSAARNRGLQMANGKYIMFVDSDDSIRKNSLKYLYTVAEKESCDVLVFGGKMDISWKAAEWMRMAFYTKNIVHKGFEPHMLYNVSGALPSVCNKLFRKECIAQMKFAENIKVAEDLVFLFNVFPTVENIRFVSKKIYRYRIFNSQSTMHYTSEFKIRYMADHIEAAKTIIKCWKKYGLDIENDQDFSIWLTSFLRAPYKQLKKEESKLFDGAINEIYKTLNKSNYLIIPEPRGGKSFPIKRIYRILKRDIVKFGFWGGIENIIFKLFFNR